MKESKRTLFDLKALTSNQKLTQIRNTGEFCTCLLHQS